MIVEARLSSLKQIKPHEFAMRFVFGGLCTLLAGLIANRFGPGVGGLFLAFPAIFPAGASLLEAHETAHKRKAGFNGQDRGRVAAGVDAAGTAIGCAGLIAFAAIVWKGLPGHNAFTVIAVASAAWVLLSMLLWLLRKSRLLRRKARRRALH